MTPERIAELRRLAEGALPMTLPAVANFLSECCTAVPELLAEVERLQGAVAAERQRCIEIARVFTAGQHSLGPAATAGMRFAAERIVEAIGKKGDL